jgi:hypothetical protein
VPPTLHRFFFKIFLDLRPIKCFLQTVKIISDGRKPLGSWVLDAQLVKMAGKAADG